MGGYFEFMVFLIEEYFISKPNQELSLIVN